MCVQVGVVCTGMNQHMILLNIETKVLCVWYKKKRVFIQGQQKMENLRKRTQFDESYSNLLS